LTVSCQLSAVRHQWQTLCVATANPKIRVAVLGVGSLGQHHARLYAELAKVPQCGIEFAGVYDTNAETARKIAAKYIARVFNSVAEAEAASDAINIVTPTTTHFELARQLLAQGKHR
jgi:predicted dehydrogenase